MGYSDSHIHLVDYSDAQIARILGAMQAEDIELVVNVAVDLESSAAGVALAERRDRVVPAVGFHPWFARRLNEEEAARFEALAALPAVKALGEIGLDYSPPRELPGGPGPDSPRAEDIGMPKLPPAPPSPEVQRELFVYELDVAIEHGLLVTVHCKGGAHPDTQEIIRRPEYATLKGIAHGFDGDLAMLHDWLEAGFSISLGYHEVVLEPIAGLEDIVQAVPLDLLIVETDANPMINPVRGPLDVITTVRRLAAILGMAPDELGRITTANLRRFLES